MTDLNDTFRTIRHRLSRGGLWSRGGEFGTIPPDEFGARDFRILLARLSTYEDTSLSFTHDILYAIFADRGWYPDWAFLPTAQDRQVYEENDIPWLFGIQSKKTWKDFDAIGIANSITQELGNLFTFYGTSGIPAEKSARMERNDIPIIIMGGANAGSASVLFHPDPLVDGIFTGEDFGAIANLFALVREGRARGMTKREILSSLECVEGFFQPDGNRPIKKSNARTMASSPLHAKMPVNWGDGNPGKAVLPISDGCAGFCSFCNESFVRKPYRESGARCLLDEARALKAESGADSVDLFSFNFNMHRDFYEIIGELIPVFPDIGLKSQRFDSIAEDPQLVEIEKALGKSVYTCGLEGISDRMRRFLNKNLSDAQVRSSIEVLVGAAVREIKVFLIATGREGSEDFSEWEKLLGWVKGLKTPQGKQVRFVFSITPLVRFPHTPLEFEPTPDPQVLKDIIKTIISTTQKSGFECRQAASVEEALFCDQLLRADRPGVFDAFRETITESGFVYEREIPESVYRRFLSKLAERGMDPTALRKDFSAEKNARAPWALLDMGVSRTYLENQYKKNSAYEQVQPDEAQLFGKGRKKPARQEIDALKMKIAAAKKDETAISFPCVLGERYAHLPREYPALSIARALMKADPAFISLYRGFSSSCWQRERETPVPLYGRDIVSLKFRSAARACIDRLPEDFWKKVNAELATVSIAIEKPVQHAPQTRSAAAQAPVLANLAGVAASALPTDCIIVITSPFDINAEYLLKSGLKHVYAKTSEGLFAYQFTKDALKKGILLSLEAEKTEQGIFRVTAKPGPKFDIGDFLQNAFKKNDKTSWLRIRAEAR
jgi:hypothetical protein